MKDYSKALHQLLSAEQIAAIKVAPKFDGEFHPAWGPLFASKANSTSVITRQAATFVWESPVLRNSMRDTLCRAASLDNIPDAAAALAELRALGSMLRAGMEPAPLLAGSKHGSTPDFVVETEDGTVTVEVHAKREDGAQTDRRRALEAGEDVPGVEKTTKQVGEYLFTTTISLWQPGGAPDPTKPNDSVQTNLISKLCGVKAGERQRREGVPSVLWLDLNTFGTASEDLMYQTQPLDSGPLGLTSGAIWHAFYGWKGAPIFEEWHHRYFTMAHDGRFRMLGAAKSHLAAAIVCFEKGLVLFENPWATLPLPAAFRSRCTDLPWFNIHNSIADWGTGSAVRQVELWKSQIEVLHALRST